MKVLTKAIYAWMAEVWSAAITQADSTVWQHVKTGGFYTVVGTAKLESTLQDVTVYRSLKDGQTWVRPTSEFAERFVAASPPHAD